MFFRCVYNRKHKPFEQIFIVEKQKTVIEFVEVHSQVSKKENTDKFLFYFFGYDFHVGGFTAKKKKRGYLVFLFILESKKRS